MDIRDMDIKSLMVFDAIYKTKNLSAAADQLDTSQPSISRCLARMRDSLNDPLFTRHRNRMLPTPKAMLMASYVEQALDSLHAGIDCFREFQPNRSDVNFRLGVNDLVLSLHANPLIQAVMRESAGVSLSFLSANYLDALSLLEKSAIDVAIVSHFSSSSLYCYEPLFQDDYVTVAREHHPLVGGGPLTLDAFSRLEHILVTYEDARSGWIDDELAKLSMHRRIRLRLPFFTNALQLVADSDLICTLPRQFARYYARRYPLVLHELPLKSHVHTFFLIWLRRLDRDPAQRWIREIVQRVVGRAGIAHQADS
ncbi:LysR family transcriptional regulator [Marinobacter sp. DUT-3]|uniref:LysR family transcriptional regulator n=1 Tax=unclassified Marinobacter TaxID=83889 RepID=UPI00387B41B8